MGLALLVGLIALRRRARPLGVVLMFVLAPALASAQVDDGSSSGLDAEARAHFDLGATQYENGNFGEASASFQRAYDLSHRAPLLHNIYVARLANGELALAADALRRYLAEADPVDHRAHLERRLAALERRLEAGSEGRVEESDEFIEDAEPGAEDDRATGGGGDDLMTAGVGVVIAGGLIEVAAAILGGLSLAAVAELDSHCGAAVGLPPDRCEAAYDQAPIVAEFELLRDLAWGSFGVGLAVIAVGAVLLGIGAGSGDSHAGSVDCSRGYCVAEVRF